MRRGAPRGGRSGGISSAEPCASLAKSSIYERLAVEEPPFALHVAPRYTCEHNYSDPSQRPRMTIKPMRTMTAMAARKSLSSIAADYRHRGRSFLSGNRD